MPNGYTGKILNVDLATREVSILDLDWDIASNYIGGRGYGAKILYDELKPGLDPLEPNNILVIATGPLTGTIAPTSGRFSISSKSPLTRTIFDSNCGGNFGWEMKRAGFDLIIIRGKSEAPVYLLIKNGKAELKSATSLMGKSTLETEAAIREMEGDDAIRTIQIGPAGENRVLLASIMSDGHRAAGRGGLGAVMGSKKLKAIAVRGNRRIEVANIHAFKKEVKGMIDVLKRNPVTGDSLNRYGTACLVHMINKAGILPVRNFTEGYFDQAEAISGEAISKRMLVDKKGCYSCPIRCGRVIRLHSGPFKGELSEGPEFETIWSFGAHCGVSDIDKIAEAGDLSDRLGLDTISLGNTIGFMIEAYKKGLITEKETGGINLDWGRADILPKLVQLTAYRKGLGRLLGKGVKRLSEEFGGSEFAMHVKGLELPAYDPRGAKGMGLAYATSNRGGCHLRAYMILSEILSFPRYLDPLKTEEKAELVKALQDVFAVLDSMILCKFTSFATFDTLYYEPTVYARLLTTATGFYFNDEEFRKVGERIYNLERLFNIREGFDRKDDTLPLRLTSTPLPSGPAAGSIIDLKEMLERYYLLRGWDINGVPSDAKLQTLGILSTPRWPKLQVALDLRDLKEALRIAEAAYSGGAEFLEAGTPLIKSVGVEAVRQLRRRFPMATIIADLKTMDAGWMETEIAAQAGADIIGIAGLANDNTIKDAVGCARKYGAKIMADLIEVKDPVKRARELERLGVDFICLHSAIDAQRDREQEVDRKVTIIKNIVDQVRVNVAVAGGIRADTAAKVVKAGAKVVIVGGAITRAADPKAATKMIKKAMEEALK